MSKRPVEWDDPEVIDWEDTREKGNTRQFWGPSFSPWGWSPGFGGFNPGFSPWSPWGTWNPWFGGFGPGFSPWGTWNPWFGFCSPRRFGFPRQNLL